MSLCEMGLRVDLPGVVGRCGCGCVGCCTECGVSGHCCGVIVVVTGSDCGK